MTAYTGFAAAKEETDRLAAGAKTVVHTGFWGCGAFGGNRTLMTAVQLLAAHLARADAVRFHAVDEAGCDDFDQGRRVAEDLLDTAPASSAPADLVSELAAREFRWGVSDGN